MNTATSAFGPLLRSWRQRRHMSQLDLACEANISTRHMSFLESGRSLPSREMLLHLAERLDVPLRERNTLLTAAGYAPVYSERPLRDPALHEVRKAVDLVLTGHEPYPALAIDRHWHLISANRMFAPLMQGIAAELLVPPINVIRLSLHPHGLAPLIENAYEWREHLLSRLRHQTDVAGDAHLAELMRELEGYPAPHGARTPINVDDYAGVVVPLRLKTSAGTLSLFSTTTVFGTPRDITVAELAIESFFPADSETSQALRSIAQSIGI
jgi:transcriptional regulator with XRE-family HTH domain